MNPTNPYDQNRNPWLHRKWNQKYGHAYVQTCSYVPTCGYTPSCGNPYDRNRSPWLYNKYEQGHDYGHGYSGCKPRRRRRYC